MKPSRRRCTSLLAALLVLAMPASATSWEDDPLPPRTMAQWALVSALVNGVPMQAQQLRSELPVHQLLSYYEGRWKRLGSPRTGRQGPWLTLSLDTEQLHLVLQVQADGSGSQGLLSQAQWRERRRDFVPAELPQLLRSQITQVTETRDGPRRSRLVTLSCEDSLELTRQRIQAHARSRGWVAVVDQQQRQAGSRQWLGSYEFKGLSVDAVLVQADGATASHLTINFIDTPS